MGLSSNAIALYNSNDVPYLLAFRSTGILFTNIETQADFFVDFGAKIEDGFLRPSTQSGVPSTEVVAWALGGSYLFTLDLTNIESALGRTPTLHKIADRVRAVSVVNDAKVLVTSVEDSFEFYVVDFDKQLVAPLRSSVPFDLDRVFVDAGRVIIGAPDYDVVSSIDLDTLDTESVVLDAPLQRLHLLRATGRAVAVHADSAGFITDLDGRDLSRAGARSFWGFILDGELDRAGGGQLDADDLIDPARESRASGLSDAAARDAPTTTAPAPLEAPIPSRTTPLRPPRRQPRRRPRRRRPRRPATPPPESAPASEAPAPAATSSAPAGGQQARTDAVAPVPIVVVAPERERPAPRPAPAPRARPAVESSAAACCGQRSSRTR